MVKVHQYVLDLSLFGWIHDHDDGRLGRVNQAGSGGARHRLVIDKLIISACTSGVLIVVRVESLRIRACARLLDLVLR